MLRTKLSLSRILTGLAACCALGVSSSALAGPPQLPGAVEPDYQASGFVVPAGYQELEGGTSRAVMHASAPYGQAPMQPVQQVGLFSSGCDMGSCDTMGTCTSCGSCDWQCAGGCGYGGLLGGGCGGGCGIGCNDGSGLSGLRHICLFCRGDGCGVCQSIGRGYLIGMLAGLDPYTEAGLGAQRWYDVSLEYMMLRQDTDAANMPITSQGQFPLGNVVLSTNSVADDDMAPGARVSLAMIWGVGGNLEATYMGFDNFGRSASFTGNPGGDLFSFFSDFGVNPNLGYDDTDRSVTQRIASESSLQSFEFNYRRRWVGPYSRFQGSWLAGFRYMEYDDILRYSTQGAIPANFFNGSFKANNFLTGFQLGGDLWWNVYPGINLGVGVNGGLLGNQTRNGLGANFNSANQLLTDVSKGDDTTWMTELTATIIYRISYSWSIRSSYHYMDLENITLASTGLPAVVANYRDGIQNNTLGTGQNLLGNVNSNNGVNFSGFSIGAEYLW